MKEISRTLQNFYSNIQHLWFHKNWCAVIHSNKIKYNTHVKWLFYAALFRYSLDMTHDGARDLRKLNHFRLKFFIKQQQSSKLNPYSLCRSRRRNRFNITIVAVQTLFDVYFFAILTAHCVCVIHTFTFWRSFNIVHHFFFVWVITIENTSYTQFIRYASICVSQRNGH